jgi:hypothetical protein
MQLVQKVRDDLSGMSQVEMEPKITGRNITMTLAPLPANRRKRRFTRRKTSRKPGAVVQRRDRVQSAACSLRPIGETPVDVQALSSNALQTTSRLCRSDRFGDLIVRKHHCKSPGPKRH